MEYKTINGRIKEIRLDKGLTQEQFAKNIGVGYSAISRIESGARNVSEQTVKLICAEYNVNERWLRFGEGDAYHTAEDELSALGSIYGLTDENLIMLRVFDRLTPDQRQTVLRFLEALADEVKKEREKRENP